VFRHRLIKSARCLSSRQKKEGLKGTNIFITTSGFRFCGVLQFLVAGKVNFNAENVAILSTA